MIEKKELLFYTHVRKYFDPLMKHYNLHCTDFNNSKVQYTSESIEINIVFDQKRSYEIDLIFSKNNQEFTIGQLIRFSQIKNEKIYCSFMASEQHRLIETIKKLFNLFEKYSKKIFLEEDKFFKQLSYFVKKEAEQYMRDKYLRKIKNDANDAWKNKNYIEVVKLYKSIENFITSSEKKKIQYAEKKLTRNS